MTGLRKPTVTALAARPARRLRQPVRHAWLTFGETRPPSAASTPPVSAALARAQLRHEDRGRDHGQKPRQKLDDLGRPPNRGQAGSPRRQTMPGKDPRRRGPCPEHESRSGRSRPAFGDSSSRRVPERPEHADALMPRRAHSGASGRSGSAGPRPSATSRSPRSDSGTWAPVPPRAAPAESGSRGVFRAELEAAGSPAHPRSPPEGTPGYAYCAPEPLGASPKPAGPSPHASRAERSQRRRPVRQVQRGLAGTT